MRHIWCSARYIAQAYDTAAYKCAADDLLVSNKVEVLFHALAVGAAMDSQQAASRRC